MIEIILKDFFIRTKYIKTKGFRGPKVRNMLRLCDEFENKTDFETHGFGKVQTNKVDRVKLFMVFY